MIDGRELVTFSSRTHTPGCRPVVHLEPGPQLAHVPEANDLQIVDHAQRVGLAATFSAGSVVLMGPR